MVKLVHFYGEMDLDLDLPADKLVKKAAHIAEMCGYMVAKNKAGNIVLLGEDAPDALNVENILEVKDGKIGEVSKQVFKIDGNVLLQKYIMEGVDDGYYPKWKKVYPVAG